MERSDFDSWVCGRSFWVCLFLSLSSGSFVCAVPKYTVVKGTVFVSGKAPVAVIDENFVCATVDWWPPEKCDYGTCSWGHDSLLNLDLGNKLLLNAIKAFSPLKIRLGGSLQDKVVYQTDASKQCPSFTKNASEIFGFSEGCLPLSRWDQLNAFFQESGAQIIFGLNALAGRTIRPGLPTAGAWDHRNAESLMRYTVSKNYTIFGWELGNELCGSGVGTKVPAGQYAVDTISLMNLVQDIYKGIEPKPLVLGPGGFFDKAWFTEYLNKTGSSVNVATHHIYNLGPGSDPHLIEKILDPTILDGVASTFQNLQSTLKSSSSSAVAWVGEAGGAYNSGRNTVTNAFVFNFWYLDQLGMTSTFNTKAYCRQTLIGGNYGLLNTTTFAPNPNYYSALLWHRLMGKNVLKTEFSGTNKIRAYTHCAKSSKGIVLLLINLDGKNTVQANVVFNGTTPHHHRHHHDHRKRNHLPRRSKNGLTREEYHLTAQDGDLHSQTMLLNGKALALDPSGGLPPLEPQLVEYSSPVTVSPYSVVFAHFPNIVIPACG
ncbi:hypothetical protein MLD38_006791 [Melastoma candidum]|uniref:Uncharacterized protein n=1 Tax=Melastoma candidum TaxID=119954 RepID=A0ACB9RNR3_9MYRT|nr:hypothetical protein MLD38_006791 [Melastoma candidum]